MSQNQKENEDYFDNCISCCCGTSLLCAGLAGLGAAVAYYVFGIMFLVEDYDTAKECSGSNLWVAVLVTLILGLINANNLKKDEEGHMSPIGLMCAALVDLGLAIWLGLELFEFSCDSLSETRLWTFGLVQFILCLFVSAIIVLYYLSLIGYVCCTHFCFKEEEKEEEATNDLKYRKASYDLSTNNLTEV